MQTRDVNKLRDMALELSELCEEWVNEAVRVRARQDEDYVRRGLQEYIHPSPDNFEHGGTRLSGDLKRRMMDLQRHMVHTRKSAYGQQEG